MTMTELLVVIAIFCSLMGMGVAAYWRMSGAFKEEGAAAQVDILLRQARNSALTANAPAYVEIDTAHRRITPWAFKTVGLWHFERVDAYGRTHGAYSEGVLRGATRFDEGKVGKCVKLIPNTCVDLGASPDFDCEDGGYLEAYVRPAPDSFTSENYIFFKEGAYGLKIGASGVLSGYVGGATVKSRSYRIAPGRWTKVAMCWNRQSLRLLVDDAIVARAPGGPAPITDHPLLVGHESANLLGLVDEVRVMSVLGGAPLALPARFEIRHTTAPWDAIYFAPDGTLDMRYHAGPVSVTLVHERRARMVSVSMLGATRRHELEKEQAPEEADSPGAPAVSSVNGTKGTPP